MQGALPIPQSAVALDWAARLSMCGTLRHTREWNPPGTLPPRPDAHELHLPPAFPETPTPSGYPVSVDAHRRKMLGKGTEDVPRLRSGRVNHERQRTNISLRRELDPVRVQRHCHATFFFPMGVPLLPARTTMTRWRAGCRVHRGAAVVTAVAALLLIDGCSAIYCGDPYVTGREKTPVWDLDGGRLSPNPDGGDECAALCRHRACSAPDGELLSCFTDVDAGVASCLCRRANPCQ